MANVLTFVWLIIGFIVFHTAMLVWGALMLPNPVERARQRIERKPYGSFFIGLFFLLGTMLVSGSLLSGGKGGGLQLLGWIAAGPMLASAIIGAAAFSRLLAERIQPRMSRESQMLAQVGGALCVALSGWMPVVGWFVFLPLTGIISIGAGAMALLSRRQVAVQPEPAPQPQWAQSAPQPQWQPAAQAAYAAAAPAAAGAPWAAAQPAAAYAATAYAAPEAAASPVTPVAAYEPQPHQG